MKNLVKFLKKGIYTGIGALFIVIEIANAAINPKTNTMNQGMVTAWTADTVVQWYISNALGFLYLIAVLYAIWWGFNILIAAWEEEKVKTWKTVIIHALIWVVVIFLAGTVVSWLMGLLGV